MESGLMNNLFLQLFISLRLWEENNLHVYYRWCKYLICAECISYLQSLNSKHIQKQSERSCELNLVNSYFSYSKGRNHLLSWVRSSDGLWISTATALLLHCPTPWTASSQKRSLLKWWEISISRFELCCVTGRVPCVRSFVLILSSSIACQGTFVSLSVWLCNWHGHMHTLVYDCAVCL